MTQPHSLKLGAPDQSPDDPGRPRYALGLDYGTNSVRALIVDADTGVEVGVGVADFASGSLGVLSSDDPNLARQSPRDTIDAFYEAVRLAQEDARRNRSFSPTDLVGAGVDTTGSTPIPVDADGRPLAFRPEFRENLDAQAWLWKDHTSIAEAEEITEAAAEEGYLEKCGGSYSSEWFWAKALHCLRVAPEVFHAAHSWMEHCDWAPAYLCGISRPEEAKRSACAAGHKAMWNSQWGGLPSAEFLARLDPALADLRRRLYHRVDPIGEVAGRLDPEIADRARLPAELPVSVGAIDAHLGAVGSGIRPGVLVKIMGTSACDIMVAANDGSIPDVPGVCGIADQSVLPGMLGLEAGQAAVGDLFHWVATRLADGDHDRLQTRAATMRPGQTGLIGLDWNNGNRCILNDQSLTGLLLGQTLATSAADIYRAMVEATAFGARRIVERLEEYGVGVDQVIVCGGIAEKSPFILQVYADVLGRPLALSRSHQTCALGAAIAGAVAGGAHPTIEAAQAAMTGFRADRYVPDPDRRSVYDRLYALYLRLHDAFGGVAQADLSGLMRDLGAIRRETRP